MPSPSAWTTKQVVEAFQAHVVLRKYTDEVEAMQITGSDLAEMDEKTVAEMFGLESKLVVKKLTAAIRALAESSVQSSEQKAPSSEGYKAERAGPKADDQTTSGKIQVLSKLPPGVRFHYFASHKKQHSRFGRDSASEPLSFYKICAHYKPVLLLLFRSRWLSNSRTCCL